MLQMRFSTLFSAFALAAVAACGGNSTDTPTSLDVTTYPAGAAFTMSLTMQACSDMCAEYDEGSCSTNVKEDEMIIEVDASLSWDRIVDDTECPNRCGPAKKVTCQVEALDAGTYTVVANGFERTITVR